MPGEELVDAGALRRRAEEDRVGPALPRLPRELPAHPGGRQRRLVADVRPEDRLVVLGEDLGQRAALGLVVRRERLDGDLAPAGVADGSHRDDTGREPPRHRLDDSLGVGAGPVDLVDEQEGRDAEPAKRAEQQRRLRLDALDRGHDEHRAIEHAEDALDLRDEVGVAGGVDEVDREVAHQERGDRGPDRDAAFALEVERVGLGGAGVDAADAIDGAGGEEEPLGEGGLTGVDVREDAEIERAHGASCLPRRWSPSGWTWVLPSRSFLASSRGCASRLSHARQPRRPGMSPRRPGTGSVGRRRALSFAPVGRGEGPEGLRIEGFPGHAGHPAPRAGPEGRRSRAIHERRSLPDDGAGADLGDLAIVDLDDEDPVEDQEHVRAGLALLHEALALRDRPDRGLRAAARMIAPDSDRSSSDSTAATTAGESCVPHGVRSPYAWLNHFAKSIAPDFSTRRPSWS